MVFQSFNLRVSLKRMFLQPGQIVLRNSQRLLFREMFG
jgi:hypothetical protein